MQMQRTPNFILKIWKQNSVFFYCYAHVQKHETNGGYDEIFANVRMRHYAECLITACHILQDGFWISEEAK
jgi:hypothetical protein